MKKILLAVALATMIACSGKSDVEPQNTNCGTHNGKQLYLGPQGGCYYLSSGGNKEYVDRSECNCTVK